MNMDSPDLARRELCDTCRRPRVVCLCPWLVTVQHTTPVVVLRHPTEARHALNTAKLLGHMGTRCQVIDGEEFASADILEPGHTALLLFPGESSRLLSGMLSERDPSDPDDAPLPMHLPLQLIVLDGTWSKARRILHSNPWLGELPQLRVELGSSRYLLRKPAPEGGSTLEAVVAALGLIEGSPERFEPFLTALDQLVQFQRQAMGEDRFQQDFGDRISDV